MKKFSTSIKNFVGILICLIAFSSCVNRSFVTTGYDPSLLEEKNDNRIAFTVTPCTQAKLSYTRAVTDKVGFSCASSGFFGFYSFSGNFVYYKSDDWYNLDLAGGFEYSVNKTNVWQIGSQMLPNQFQTAVFNATYYSPFVAGSLILKTSKKRKFGISIKSAINFADHYNYFYKSEPYTGRETSFQNPFDNETFNKVPPPFLSMEPALNYFFCHTRYDLRFQLGYNYRGPGVTHNYNFPTQGLSNYPCPTGFYSNTTLHPTINPIIFNICWFFHF